MKSYEEKAKFFDQYAEQWDEDGFSDEQVAKLDAILERLDIKPGMTILEPGCGSGRLTKILSERVGPGGRIIAVDISPQMIEVCGRATKNRNVRAILGEVEKVEMEPQSVDLVLCFAAFPHFNDKPAALRAFKSCLKPDGCLAIVHLMGSARINDLHRKSGTAVERDTIPVLGEMEQMLRQAGFRIVEWTDNDDGYFLSAYLVV
ncbi:MAG: methyltransferase domain-containing protein [Planctomycetota bacterium]